MSRSRGNTGVLLAAAVFKRAPIKTRSKITRVTVDSEMLGLLACHFYPEQARHKLQGAQERLIKEYR